MLKASALFAFSLAAINVAAQDETTIYGSVVASTQWQDNTGPGIYSFSSKSGGFTPVKIDNRLAAQGGGVYAKGKYYSINADTRTLNVYDADTWELLSSKPATNVALDLAYDPTTDNIFGCFSEGGKPVIGTLDPETGGYTFISDIENTLTVLVCTTDGQLYGVSGSHLVKVNKETGVFSFVGNVGIEAMYAQSATVDPTTGKCYWASMEANMSSVLYEMDLTTAQLTQCRTFTGMEEITGLYILPHVADGAPARVTDLKATFEKESTTGTVSFTMPSTTKAGGKLSGNLSYRVEAGNEVKTGTATAGQELSLPLTVNEGRCKILVTTSNTSGESERTAISLWVGKDTPAAVTGVKLQYTNDNMLGLSWNAVEKGKNGGYIDASKVRYRIVRQPDNTVVQDNYQQTQYSETASSTTLAKRWYEVTPYVDGESGDTAVSNKVVVGPGKDVPYSEDFSSDASFDYFTVLDANNDGKTWYRSGDAQTAQYGGDATQKADDWLILPPLKVSKAGYYKLSLQVRCNSANPQLLSIALGSLPETKDMNTVILPETTVDTKFETKTVEAKFGVKTDGNYFLGIHLASNALMHSFDIDNIRVEQITSSDAPAQPANLIVKPAAKGELKAEVEFSMPEKTIAGENVGKLTKAEVYRNGTLLKSITDAASLVAGKRTVVKDESPQNGFNKYKVVAYNASGTGDDATVETYVGIDTPAAVENIVVDETEDGTVDISWAAPQTGVNGGYINAENLTYSVKRNGWLEIEGTPGKCEVRDVIDDLGDGQRTIGYTITATSTAGTSVEAYSPYLSVGRPYETPFVESFAKGRSEYTEWTSFPVMGERNWSPSNNTDAQDGDNGYISFTNVGSETADLLLMSPKVRIDNTVHPILSFYTKHSAVDDKMQVEVHTHDGKVVDVLDVDLTAATSGWEKHEVDLSAYAQYRYVQIGFRTDNVAKDDMLYLDRISVVDQLDHNLMAVGLKAPRSIKVGMEKTVTATVSNVGMQTASGYSVKLYNGDELLDVKEGAEVKTEKSVDIDFTVKPEVRQLPALNLKAVVEYSADENLKNNTASIEVPLVAPTYPVATGLTGQWQDNAVALTWNAPDLDNLEPEASVEDFESYEAFTITDFGKWTVNHVDGQDYSMEFMTSDGKWITYPHSGDGITFQVIDLPQVKATEADGWSSVSGNKILIAPYTGSNKDDWFISPELYGGKQTVRISAKSLNNCGYGLENLDVYYSTTGKNPSDFVSAGIINELPEYWMEYSFNLPDGAKYFAIRAKDINSALFIDDIEYIPLGAPAQQFVVKGYNVYRNSELLTPAPVAVAAYTDATASPTGNYSYRVSVVYDKGESDFSLPFTIGETGIGNIAAEELHITVAAHRIMIGGIAGKHVLLLSVDGKRVADFAGKDSATVSLPAGYYIVKVDSKAVKVFVP